MEMVIILSMNEIISKLLLFTEFNSCQKRIQDSSYSCIVLVDFLRKTKNEYKKLKNQEDKYVFMKTR